MQVPALDASPRGWGRLVRVLLFFVSCAAVLALTAPLARSFPGLRPELVIGTLTSLVAFALTVLFVRWEGVRLDDVGAAPDRGSLRRLALGFLVGLLLVALHSAVLAAGGEVRWARAPSPGLGEATAMLVGYLALSCREELAFHGYPLRSLQRVVGLAGAQVLVAFAFAAEHRAGGMPWVESLIGPGVGSLLFGMAAIATRGLALPIGLHAAWNVGDWVRGGKGSPGFWTAVVEEAAQRRAQFVGLLGYVLVIGLATLAFWWWYRRGSRAARDAIPAA